MGDASVHSILLLVIKFSESEWIKLEGLSYYNKWIKGKEKAKWMKREKGRQQAADTRLITPYTSYLLRGVQWVEIIY